MARVVGIGGIFFKSPDPKALNTWYRQHLGIEASAGTGAMFKWLRADQPAREEMTIWSVFPDHSKYFEPSKAPFMMNYIVDDLDAVLSELRASGVTVDERREDHEYGRFGWIMDPDGNRIELWQPPAPEAASAKP